MMERLVSFRIFAVALAVAMSMNQGLGFDIRELYGKPVQGSVSLREKGGGKKGEGENIRHGMFFYIVCGG